MRKSFVLAGHPHPKGTSSGDASRPRRGAARRAHGSSAEHAMRDLIASHAPLQDGSHKARQNGPKHYPGDSRGRSPLARLSPLSFAVQRKMEPSETVGCRTWPVNPHDLKPTHSYLFNILYSIFFLSVPEGRSTRRAPGKHVQSKTITRNKIFPRAFLRQKARGKFAMITW